MPPRTASRRARRVWASHAFRRPSSKPLLRAVDNGPAIRLDPLLFAPAQRDRGWGAFVDGFIRANEPALARLDCRVEVAGGPDGAVIRIMPGATRGRCRFVPLRPKRWSGASWSVPRFEWAGVGRVLQETGWAAAPEFLDLPLVPGSGREIPPWVLAGPVIGRLAELLRTAKRGYRDKVEDLRRPRGRILWAEYTSEKMPAGKWDTLPCRFSDLAADPKLRRWVRWGLERVRTDLVSAGGHDRLAMQLAHEATRLMLSITESPLFPARRELEATVGRRDICCPRLSAAGCRPSAGWSTSGASAVAVSWTASPGRFRWTGCGSCTWPRTWPAWRGSPAVSSSWGTAVRPSSRCTGATRAFGLSAT